MVTEVERLVVRLEATTKQYENALLKANNTTKAALKKVERSMQASATRQQTIFAKMGTGIQSTLQRSLFGPLAALAGGAGLARLAGSVRGAIGEVASLAEQADKVGLLVEELQELRFAAEQTGVSQGNLDMAMQRFSRRVGEAVQGSGELVGTLRQYNIALTDGAGKTRPLIDILKDYADAIQNADSQQERLRIAFKGFDSEGAALVNTLKDGAAGLEGYRAAAREAGIITGEAAEKARRLDERFKAAAHTLDTAWKNAVIGAVEAMGDLGPLTKFIADEMKGFAQGLATSKREIEAIINIFDALTDVVPDVPVEDLEQDLANVRQVLAEHQKRLDAATNDAQRHFIRIDIAAAEAEIKRLEAAIFRASASLIGPAFEQMGRDAAGAFEAGFKPKVALPTVTRGAGGDSAQAAQQFTVPGANGPVSVTVTGRVNIEPAGIESALQPLESAVDRGITVYDEHGRAITGEARRTADGIRDIPPGFDRLGDRFASAIGQQTSALTAGLARMEAASAAANAANTSGAFGGSIGGTQAMKFSVNVAAQKQLDALANDRNVIQSGLGLKQLTPEQEREAQLELARIDLDTAKLNQHMGEVASAFQDLHPMINQMLLAGYDFEAVVDAINSDLKHKLGTVGNSNNYFSSTRIPTFAGGGVLRGPGGPTGDKIPIMASNEEFYVNAAMSKKHRALLWAINEDRLQGLADGGIVTRLNGAAQRLASGGAVQAPAAAAGREVHVTANVNVSGATDANSFRRSSREVARQMAAEIQYAMQE